MTGGDGWEFDLATVLDSIQDVAFVVDEDLELAVVNDRFEEAVGVAEEQLVGTPVADVADGNVQSGEDVERFLDLVRAVLQGERDEARLEVPATAGMLGDRVVETRLSPVERDGDVVGVVGIARDVTRRHDYYQQLEVRNEELAVLNRVLRHDVRNDMAVVDGWLGELVDDLEGEQRRVAEMARDAARHTIELTGTARDYAAIVAEGAEPDLEPVDLGALLADELDRHRALYPAATYDVDGDLPDVDVLANPMLQSVFTNLLHNAVQHHDREDPRVTLAVEVSGDTVAVRVADDGPGLREAVRDRLFQRGATSLDEASSLGLYLVDRLVTAFGGSVSVEDSEPRGTVFVVELRRAEGHH